MTTTLDLQYDITYEKGQVQVLVKNQMSHIHLQHMDYKPFPHLDSVLQLFQVCTYYFAHIS